jgi:hypothetical protein
MSRTRSFELRSLFASIVPAIFTLTALNAELVRAQNPPASARIKVQRADQLPRHLYPIESTAMALFTNEAQFAAVAKRLETDLRADLASYDIQDRATL